MATRSSIGIENADGTVTGVYCHWDGYLSHNGKLLYENFSTEEKVRELLSYGDIDSLGESIGEKHPFHNPYDFGTPEYQQYRSTIGKMTTFLGRDCNESDIDAIVYDNDTEFNDDGQEYVYLFRNGKWFVRRDNPSRWSLLTRRLIDMGEL
jgi:hypothetical protein